MSAALFCNCIFSPLQVWNFGTCGARSYVESKCYENSSGSSKKNTYIFFFKKIFSNFFSLFSLLQFYQLFLEQCVNIMNNSATHLFHFFPIALMEGHTVQESKNVISNLLWPSMKLNWTVVRCEAGRCFFFLKKKRFSVACCSNDKFYFCSTSTQSWIC